MKHDLDCTQGLYCRAGLRCQREAKLLLQFVLTVWLLAFCPCALEAQDEAEADDPQLTRLIEKSMDGLKSSFRTPANLMLDDIGRFLNLDNSDVAKSKILIKGVAGKIAQKSDAQISKYLRRLWGQGKLANVESFSVNGKIFMFDPNEELPEETAKAKVRVSIDLFAGEMQVAYQGGASGFGWMSDVGKVSEMKFWNLALKKVEPESIERYREFEKERARRGMVRGVMALLGSELELSPEQSSQLEELIQDKIEVSPKGSLDSIYQIFVENRQMYELQPDFLSAAQLAMWNLLKVSARHPSWG